MDVRRIVIGAVLVVLGCTPGFALARGGGHWMYIRDSINPDRVFRTQKHDMQRGCQTHGQAMTPAIEQLTARMQEVVASNDLAQMRAVLTQAQQQLTAIKDYMGMCVPHEP